LRTGQVLFHGPCLGPIPRPSFPCPTASASEEPKPDSERAPTASVRRQRASARLFIGSEVTRPSAELDALEIAAKQLDFDAAPGAVGAGVGGEVAEGITGGQLFADLVE